MCRAIVYRALRILRRHQAVNKARGKRVAAADAVEDFQIIVLLRQVNFAIAPAHCAPVVSRCGLHGPKRRRHGLEVGICLCGLAHHSLVALEVQRFEVLVVSFDFEAKTGCKVLLVSDHNVNILRDLAVDLLRPRLAADGFPHGRPVVEVIGDDRPVFLRGFDGLNDGFVRLFGNCGVNAAGMEPAHAKGPENIVKIVVLRAQMRHSSIRPVGAADCAPDAEAPLGKIDGVSRASSDSVKVQPADERRVDPALADHVLQKPSHFVVRKRRNDRGLHAEAFPKASCDVILAAAFPGCKVPRCFDSALARVEPEQDLAHGNLVKGVGALLF